MRRDLTLKRQVFRLLPFHLQNRPVLRRLRKISDQRPDFRPSLKIRLPQLFGIVRLAESPEMILNLPHMPVIMVPHPDEDRRKDGRLRGQ